MRSLRDGIDPASAEEFQSYTGSATNREKGLRQRGKRHIIEFHRDELKSTSAVHAYGIEKDVVNHLRVTAAWDQDDVDGVRYTCSYEGLLMTYLGLQNSGNDGTNVNICTGKTRWYTYTLLAPNQVVNYTSTPIKHGC